MTARVGRGPNPPGRNGIAYRLGRQADFAADLVARLGGRPELAGLTTREVDDPAVALLHAWATTLDVLAFYQERIANEGFLGTATERGSVLMLARAIGYELRPGVAATTWLSFTVTATPGAPDGVPIPAGSQAQSVPGPGELPQVFETVTPLLARPELNAVGLRVTAPRAPRPGDATLHLAGTDTVLVAGSVLLVLGPDWFDVRRVRAAGAVLPAAATALDGGAVVPAYTVVGLDAAVTARSLGAELHQPGREVQVHLLAQRAALFGHQAQPWSALPVALRVGELNPGTNQVLPGAYATRKDTWVDAPLGKDERALHLDQSYPSVVAGSWLVLETAGVPQLRRVDAVAELPVADFGIAARTTRVTVAGGDSNTFSRRTTTVLGDSRLLPPADPPLTTPLAATATLELARPTPGLEPGRPLVLTGVDPAGEPVGEVVTVLRVRDATTVDLTANVARRYRRDSVRVLGNVTSATHGESRAEVLGGGDARRAFQRFTLRHVPLTHVPAATASGSRTTLAVWVDGVRWQEVPALLGQAPTARVYTVRRADDGTVTVTFGDGLTGARLPSGQDNVVATYRSGIGRLADLAPGRLTIPLSRPLGLMEVDNPVPAAGADDPEGVDRARRNAPLAVRTLGRVVSLDDYADFARAFAGIGKARADLVWDDARQVVLLTVAGPDGAEIPQSAPVHADLLRALDAARQAAVPVRILGHHRRRVAVTARLLLAPGHRFTLVAAAARAAVVTGLSFDARDYARPVRASEVQALLHGVPGVAAVVLELLHDAEQPPERLDVIPAAPGRRVGDLLLPADLLTVDAGDVTLLEAS
ncbi:putative baseplate assembly protein [Micromonospora sp. WMMD714]|uniref:putative baseplate assembly protein n=1 Tax=Micromonospora sp. WMMD714 TaxID=3016097 RepID=UPI00249A7A91|nr:putative baseplate assembly protein [Micromonospora sp. WMMD714]WFE66039.1 putative baseplate assembly protein [Micromonospora sp. WMMD714]